MYEFLNKKTVKVYANADGNFTDGYQGDGFEMFIKLCAGVKKWNEVSPTGQADFAIGSRHYDVKQNGSPIKYGDKSEVAGSSRVIYATHVAYTIIERTAEYMIVEFDIANTEFFIVDKHAFVKFLKGYEKPLCKDNPSRHQLNIQTVYNYSKNAPHGRKGQYIREWCYENELDTELKDKILEVAYSL